MNNISIKIYWESILLQAIYLEKSNRIDICITTFAKLSALPISKTNKSEHLSKRNITTWLKQSYIYLFSSWKTNWKANKKYSRSRKKQVHFFQFLNVPRHGLKLIKDFDEIK